MENIVPLKMELLLKKSHDLILKSEDIKIYSHNDCDGLTSGAILSHMLNSLKKEHEIEFISLDKIDELKLDNELTIFSDLGSGQNIEKLSKSLKNILILDHHPPIRTFNFNKSTIPGELLEINCNYFGIDGSTEICGGGISYLLARTFGCRKLSWLGVLAGVGDMQNTYNGKFIGLNRSILDESVELEKVSYSSGLSFYGRQTRPIYKSLSYFGDFPLYTTNNPEKCEDLLKYLNIDPNKTINQLTFSEEQKLISELNRMLSKEVPGRYVLCIPKLLIGESYEFLKEETNTPLRDASEFSSAINACSRNNHTDVAFKILKGDRNKALKELGKISKKHKTYLAKQISKFEEDENKIKKMDNLQYFADYDIKSEVVGTIAGMVLSYADWRKPILAFTPVNTENNKLKVSLRCSRLLAYDGIHFGKIIKDVSQKVGGTGGGHSVACGAYINQDKQNEFLNLLNQTLNDKLNI